MRWATPFVLLLFVSTTARATEPLGLNMRMARPVLDPAAGLALEPVATAEPNALSLSLSSTLSVDAYRLRIDAVYASRLSSSAGWTDLIATYSIGHRFVLGAHTPLTAVSGGDLLAQGFFSSPPSISFGDPRMSAKVTLIDNRKGPATVGFGMALRATTSIPIGYKANFSSDRGFSADALLLAEYAYLIGSLQGSLGYRYRSAPQAIPDVPSGGLHIGDETLGTFGLLLKPRVLLPQFDPNDRHRLELGVLFTLPIFPTALGDSGASRLVRFGAVFGDRFTLSEHVTISGGIQLSLTHSFGDPLFSATLGLSYFPQERDRDQDGIPDSKDECPTLPEDRDGIQDNDGCPEDDADEDGIPDAEDACPLKPGEESPDRRKNGCPPDENPPTH